MIPQPVHKRTRSIVLTYTCIGLSFLVISICVTDGIYQIHKQTKELPNYLRNETLKPDEPQGHVQYKETLSRFETQMISQVSVEFKFLSPAIGDSGVLHEAIHEDRQLFCERVER